MSILNTVAPTEGMSKRGDSAVLTWIKRYPIIAMVTLMYLLAWPKLIASATDSYGLTHLHLSPIFDLVTGWAPAIAAFTIAALVQGKEGVQELGRKTLRWRVGIGWYLVVLFGAAAIILADGGAYEILNGRLMALPITQIPLVEAAGSFTFLLLLYMMVNTEEIAWRGFVLPRLQSRHGALVGSLLLWVPWTLLHLPYFFTKDSILQQIGFVAFASGTLMLTIVFTWLFNNTKGSVFICTVLHAAINSWSPFLIPEQSAMPSILGYALDGALLLFIILLFGAARLSHKRDQEPFVY